MLKIPFFVFIVLLFYSCASFAGDDEKKGHAKYKAGEYAEALKYYHLAEKNILENENSIDYKLAYNLGITLYRLGQYQKSEQYLNQSIKLNPQYGSAYLNLALAQIKLNKLSEARFSLEFLVNNSQSTFLMNAANKLLSRLDEENSVNIPFIFFAWLGAEDQGDSIAGEPVSHESNSFFEFMILYTKQINDDYKNGYGLTANMFSILYEHDREYNLYLFSLGVDKRFTHNRFLFKSGFDLAQSYFGSTAYQRTLGINLNAQYKVNKQLKLKTRLFAGKIHSLAKKYDYLNGYQVKARSSIVYKMDYFQELIPRIEFEYNDNEDIKTDTLTSSQSPGKIKLDMAYKIKHGLPWIYKAKMGFRYSRYPGKYISSIYNERRVEKQISIKLGLEKTLSKKLSMLLDYSYSNNQSTIDVFSYEKNKLTLGIAYTN